MEIKNLNDFSSLTGKEIVQLLEEPTSDRRPLKRKLIKEARAKGLIQALQESKIPLTQQILCDILGERQLKTAVPVILNCLNSQNPVVKDRAAEALGKIGDPKAGETLLNKYITDQRVWYAIALGAINYQPAIPYLIADFKKKQ